MTQLMLFDAPASVSVAAPLAPTVNEPAVSEQASARDTAKENAFSSNRRRAAVSGAGDARRPSRQETGQRGGMHHMGDLARLVLMRYEMVHRRRAALAQRQQARCAG